jgi:hypothetical protein
MEFTVVVDPPAEPLSWASAAASTSGDATVTVTEPESFQDTVLDVELVLDCVVVTVFSKIHGVADP